MSMKTDSSPLVLNFKSVVGTISIMPSAYGRSICSLAESGAASGSMREATMTELVVSSGDQKSGTVSVCLTSDTFAGVALFWADADADAGSLMTTYTS